MRLDPVSHNPSLPCRQKVREQIARDRAEKAAREKEASQHPTHPQPQPSASPPPKKEYNVCKLQVIHSRSESCCTVFSLASSE